MRDGELIKMQGTSIYYACINKYNLFRKSYLHVSYRQHMPCTLARARDYKENTNSTPKKSHTQRLVLTLAFFLKKNLVITTLFKIKLKTHSSNSGGWSVLCPIPRHLGNGANGVTHSHTVYFPIIIGILVRDESHFLTRFIN